MPCTCCGHPLGKNPNNPTSRGDEVGEAGRGLSGDGSHRCPGDLGDVMSHQRQALPEKRRVQVVEEKPLDEFTPAAHSDLLEDATEMVLDGVLGNKEFSG